MALQQQNFETGSGVTTTLPAAVNSGEEQAPEPEMKGHSHKHPTTKASLLFATLSSLRRGLERAVHDENIIIFLLAGRWLGLIPPVIALFSKAGSSKLAALIFCSAVAINLALGLWHAKFDRWVLRQPLVLSLDIFAAGVLLMLSGGAASPYFVYALIPVLAASYFLSSRAGLIAALAFTPLYGLAVLWPLAHGRSVNAVAIAVQLLSFYGIAAIFAYQSVLLRRLRQAYGELHSSQEEAARIQTLAAMGKMVAYVAHEIRNPLTTIGGYAARIIRKSDDAAMVKEYSNIISAEVLRLEELLNETLTLARPHQAELTPGNIHEVLDRACLLASGDMYQHGILLSKDFALGSPPINVNHASLLRAFLNVILNAIQALPSGGAISIVTRAERDYIEVVIADSGPGIAPEILSTLWTPFVTNREQGTGLGLAITKQIIKDHGGSVTAENKDAPQHGARFIFRLPFDESAT